MFDGLSIPDATWNRDTIARLRMMAAPELLRGVADAAGLSVGDLTGPRRHKRISEARHVAMWLLRERGLSYQAIAWRLGRTDHTSAIHGVRRGAAAGSAAA